MKNLILSTAPALVVVTVLSAFYPVFSRGFVGAETNQLNTGQFVSCEELQLAIGADETTVIHFFFS